MFTGQPDSSTHSLVGSYAVADFNAGANDVTKAYARNYRGTVQDRCRQLLGVDHDAVSLLAFAMNTVKRTEPEAVRKALTCIRPEGIAHHRGTEDTEENRIGYAMARPRISKFSLES